MWHTPSCPVQMQAGVCGRPVHRETHKADTEPVCLMHSRDPDKRSGVLYSEFLLAFYDILDAAGTGTADFTSYVFPHLSLRSREIEANCNFNYADFEEEVYLYQVTFKREVDFTGANFLQSIVHNTVRYEGRADFDLVNFHNSANFNEAAFCNDVNFSAAKFLKNAYFQGTSFQGDADLGMVEFQGLANFSNATFSRFVTLANSNFAFTALFLRTTFADEADLSHIDFTQGATFPQAKFAEKVSFEGSTFSGDTHFLGTRFEKVADFNAAKFLASASFRETHFRSDDSLLPGPVFSLVRFASNAGTLFYKTDLSQALFHNCDIANVTFSSVTWRKRARGQNLMVLEEDVPLESEHASTLTLAGGERDYGLIAQLYQQLKKNYDDHLDYWAADHFHYGEMEMQRLAAPTSGPVPGLRAFYHHHLSLIAWYRRGSSYGNSYLRPAMWLGGILLLFTLLFPIAGLRQSNPNPAAPPSNPITYRSVWHSASETHDRVWAELKLVGKSFLTTIDTATFQRTSEYQPAYPYGRALAILETLLTSTVFALFLLAIRRQFRR